MNVLIDPRFIAIVNEDVHSSNEDVSCSSLEI